jgi:hypothetical protein
MKGQKEVANKEFGFNNSETEFAVSRQLELNPSLSNILKISNKVAHLRISTTIDKQKKKAKAHRGDMVYFRSSLKVLAKGHHIFQTNSAPTV